MVCAQELFLQVNITSRCNLSCAHCYGSDAPADMDVELFAETIRQFEDLRSRLGIDRSWVQLSGGEPLTHPHFASIIEQSASAFPTKVLTNGTTVDLQTATVMSKHCESVQVSFDGEKETHDQRRGSGSFAAALSGLRTLRSAGVRLSARMTVGADNCGDVESLFRLLEPNIDAFHVSRVVPIGGCETETPDKTSYRRIIYRLYALRATNRKIGLRDPFFGPLINTDEEESTFCGCSAGISGLCVTDAGDIYPCRRLPVRLGNIRESSLTDVYFGHPLLQRLRNRDLGGRCGRCEHKRHCGGSRCIAFAVAGDPLAADPGCIYE